MYEPIKQGSVLNHYKYKKTKQNKKQSACRLFSRATWYKNMQYVMLLLNTVMMIQLNRIKKNIAIYSLNVFSVELHIMLYLPETLGKNNRHTFQVSVVLSSSCSLFSVMAPQRLQLITLLYKHQHTFFIIINNPAVQSALLLNHRRAAGWALQLKAYMHASMTQTPIHTHNKKHPKKLEHYPLSLHVMRTIHSFHQGWWWVLSF